jgi:hypothetical protein
MSKKRQLILVALVFAASVALSSCVTLMVPRVPSVQEHPVPAYATADGAGVRFSAGVAGAVAGSAVEGGEPALALEGGATLQFTALESRRGVMGALSAGAWLGRDQVFYAIPAGAPADPGWQSRETWGWSVQADLLHGRTTKQGVLIGGGVSGRVSWEDGPAWQLRRDKAAVDARNFNAEPEHADWCLHWIPADISWGNGRTGWFHFGSRFGWSDGVLAAVSDLAVGDGLAEIPPDSAATLVSAAILAPFILADRFSLDFSYRFPDTPLWLGLSAGSRTYFPGGLAFSVLGLNQLGATAWAGWCFP